MNKEIVALAYSVAKDDPSLTNYDADQALRTAFLKEAGIDLDRLKDYNTFRRYKETFYAILSETISPIINERFDEVMGQFAEVRNVDWGDSTEFRIENPELFEVARIADGTSNLRRQRITEGKMNVTMSNWGIKIYDEFYRFLAGRINWGELVNRVARSYERKIGEAVVEAIYGTYNDAEAPFLYTGPMDEGEVLDVLAAVEAQFGAAVLVGTKPALARIRPDYVGDEDRERYNALGYLGHFRGYDMIALNNFFRPQTTDFALSNDDLLVLPTGDERFVKVVHEGNAIIIDEQNVKGDLSLEHTFIKKMGVGVPETETFGVIRFTS